jgi:hypothetical protein
MYPGAKIVVRSYRGRPLILAADGNLIRLVSFRDLDAENFEQTA